MERPFRVQYVIRSCLECDGHGRFVHGDVAAALDRIDESALPDGWEDDPLDERLLVAVREGLLAGDEARPDTTE
ncbi:hypothetical protein Hbl1158_09100 [Halobaculum sp. CBA1158]|uniref:hypothetical protein n=1 Tax=Halobaculum sp. CBA1158 TaxID=2904243 RepID=UPI001F2E1796|nr:hypothetical protein [Halobaculum sp. CBA1158]UIO98706.1 hypothetical protein Hbl1158_09100 [Halobaculum sp. CBA1158]